METKISKAQLEVWRWKEKAYNKVKDLPLAEQLKAIDKMARKEFNRIKFKKAMESSIAQAERGEVISHEDLIKDSENW
jgi:hypothetical protein